MTRLERERLELENDAPMKLDEAADFLGVCRQTLAREARAGTVPCIRIGRQYVFFKSALKQFCLEKDSNET